MEIIIRKATLEDRNILQLLNDQVFIDNAKYDPDLNLEWAKSELGEKYFSDLLQDPKAFCIIASYGKKNIAYLAGRPKSIDYRKSKYVELENMGVIPEFHSQRVGSRLIKEFFDWAKKASFDKVILSAYSKNKQAIEFYKKHGLTNIDVSLEKSL